MTYTITTEVTEDMYIPILNLIHDSFQEHLDKGMSFTCSNYTIEDLKKKVVGDGNQCFVAISEEGVPIGISSVKIKENGIEAYANIIAITPSAKGTGVGTALYTERKKYLINTGCKYMMSDTSVNATSSVNWHINKCKCSIVGYRSFPSTNYYSYVFREDFEEISWIRKNVIYKLKFVKAYIRTRLYYKENGKLSKLGKMLKVLKK